MSLGPLPGGAPISPDVWAHLNRALVAKAISEFTYEEALAPEQVNDRDGFELRLRSGVVYRFRAARRIWSQLSIRPESLERFGGSSEIDAARFLLDAQTDLGVAPDTLCHYLKEVSNTLMADARIAARNESLSGDALGSLPGQVLQLHLDGHPKAPANKGRLGWGLPDYEAYAPEFGPAIKLFWIAAARSTCRIAFGEGIDEDFLLANAMSALERERLAAACFAAGVDDGRHVLLPVHPWQWDNMIASHFAGEIAARRIVPLGAFGDPWLPQQSLRTLANSARPEALHVKLPLTILNTSAWRGVPGKYMDIGPDLSRWLSAVVRNDPVLAKVTVLEEVAGLFYPHPHYGRIVDAPYQFLEMLGVIWRKSPDAGLMPGRRTMMIGALAQRGADGQPVASALIARSGLDAITWLEMLFEAVVVPLYHFLCRYGVGFIAHGQNVTLILDGDVPVGMAVKDFQGDLDLVDHPFAELESLPEHVRRVLATKPPEHLIHHLQTGHFVTVLRFLSEALTDHDTLPETDFYAALARVLRRYQARNPELGVRFALFDLFTPRLPRICINRVRLAIGYADSNRRPVPTLGTPLVNPLVLAEAAPEIDDDIQFDA